MSLTANINNDFFKGSYKQVWKKVIPPGLTEVEADFICEIAVLNNESHVLDLMCGYGRHALELTKRGVKVTAIDNLKEYIDEIKLLAEEKNLPVTATQSDIVNAELNGEFNAAVCMGNSFAFFDKENAISILKNISNHLKQDGILIINSWMIAEIAIKNFKPRDWYHAGDFKCLVESKYQFHPSRIEFEHTAIAGDGSIEITNGIDYVFSLNELEEMFNEAGLTTAALYSTPRKRPFNLGDGQIYIVAKKNI